MKAVAFENNIDNWEQIKDRIIAIENEAFEVEPFPEDVLKRDFLDSDNVVVLLKDESEIVGFTYAKPREPDTPDDSPAKPGETAMIWDTVIDKRYRGQGLLRLMMEKLEEELRARGFKYMERNARIANNFATNIAKNYGDRIIKSFPLDSQWGPQVFFRIRL